MDVVKFIQNELIVRNIKQKDFAKEIGVSESVFSDYINRDRLEIPFPSIKRAMKILCGNNFPQIMEFVCGNTQKPDNMRMILEYASISRNLPLLEKMINSLMKEGTKEKEWAKVYTIALRFQTRDTSNSELIALIDKTKAKSEEMIILRKILLARVYYRMKEYDSMFREAREAEKALKALKPSYFSKTFTVRLDELFAQGFLYVNGDTVNARIHAKKVINNETISAIFKTHAYHIVGTSFLFENYEMAIENFENYLEVLKSQRRDDLIDSVLERDIFFAKVFWSRDLENISTNDKLELAHYEAKLGNLSEVEILTEEYSCPFKTCYMGIAKKDPNLLLESFFKFLGAKQKFFAQLPAKYLMDYPGHEMTVKLALENINVA